MQTIVTKSSLMNLLADPAKRPHVIGRALVVLFNRQTQMEKQTASTNVDNMRGFQQGDAKSGTITAKYYLKHNTLLQWQVDKWMKLGSKGYPRIVKYHRQLNEAANEKRGTC